MVVKKRSGRIEKFDIEKIVEAVQCAFNDANNYFSDKQKELFKTAINEQVTLLGKEEIDVEEIQNIVEETLLSMSETQVAKSFIIYREKHNQSRFIKDKISFIGKYIKADNAADASNTDSNANVKVKNMVNLAGEVYKDTNRLINRQFMKNKLEVLYPEEGLSKQYISDIEKNVIYIHDESTFPFPTKYCAAVTLYPLILNGTGPLDGTKTTAPKNLNAFCGQLINAVFILSSQVKGAVGLGDFFVMFEYMARKEFGDDFVANKDKKIVIKNIKKDNYKTIEQSIEQAFQHIVYSINQVSSGRSFQSPFVNFSFFDKYYYQSMFDGFVFPDGSKSQWENIKYLQKLFMKWFNKERTKTMLTYPVTTNALLYDAKTKKFLDEEFKHLTAEMLAEGFSTFVYVNDDPSSLSSCCRLSSKISNNVFMRTSGMTGLMTGSCNVITLNLNHIIQDYFYQSINVEQDALYLNNQDEIKIRSLKEQWHNNKEIRGGFKAYLETILERVYKYHIAFKTMLYEFDKAGLYADTKAGYIKIEKLYSTFGINGINEMAMFLGYEVSNNEEYKKFLCEVYGIINKFITAKSKNKWLFNLECVPAESLGSKNFIKDKELGYYVPDDGRVLYNSYNYDAHDKNTDILDKLKLQGGEMANSCTGGSACHINLDSHLSKTQYLKIMDIAAKENCKYFCFNIPNSECDDCGYIEKVPFKKCPKCGSDKITYYTRVIGYLVATKNFDKYRREEEKQRVYTKAKYF